MIDYEEFRKKLDEAMSKAEKWQVRALRHSCSVTFAVCQSSASSSGINK